MEPARLRAMLARTPGLVARHLSGCLSASLVPGGPLPPDLLERLAALELPPRSRAWLKHPDQRLIDSDLRWITANDARILAVGDPDFPAGLLHRDAAAPATLYVMGDPGCLGGPTLAIMGPRQCTPAGLDTAQRFACELAGAGLTLIAGLGPGLDTAVHEGAPAGRGRGIGVCVTGLDTVYPGSSRGLAARLRREGCLVSPFPPGAAPRRHHFVQRNRLVGTLGAGTLVVEAAADYSPLLGAHQTGLLGARVFAIPGSIRDPQARGCNQLIRAGATLVQESGEILCELGINTKNQEVTRPQRSSVKPESGPSPLDNKSEMLLDAAGFEPVDIDVVAFRTGWSGHDVAAMLLLLELQGRIAPRPGGRYCRLS